MNIVAQQQKEIMRPLKVLVPLIKEDLKQGDEAAKSAAMPYYRAAGKKMIEAKSQIKRGDFGNWIKRTFHISSQSAGTYMAYARTTSGRQNESKLEFGSLREFQRHTGRDARPSGGYVHREWRPDVDAIAERARREAERITQEDLTRKQEREAETKLALRLIDIGYKVLAKELHPDKGGSRDAMQRLSRVRDRLKASA